MRRAIRPRTFWRDTRGVAAVEAALIFGLLSGALVNVAEVGRYVYTSASVVAATQAGVQSAAGSCDLNMTPATINCAGLSSAVDAGLHGGTLGAQVTRYGALDENWYCLDSRGVLQSVGAAASAPPTDCSQANYPQAAPVLYLRVSGRFIYTPMFPGLTIVDTFPPAILRTAWMRMS